MNPLIRSYGERKFYTRSIPVVFSISRFVSIRKVCLLLILHGILVKGLHAVTPVRVDSVPSTYFFGNHALLYVNNKANDFFAKYERGNYSPVDFSDTVAHSHRFYTTLNNYQGNWIYVSFYNGSKSRIDRKFYIGNFQEIILYYQEGDSGIKKIISTKEQYEGRIEKAILSMSFQPQTFYHCWFYILPVNNPLAQDIYFAMAENESAIVGILHARTLSPKPFWLYFMPVVVLSGCLLCMMIFSIVYRIQTGEKVFTLYFYYLFFTLIYFFHRSFNVLSFYTWTSFLEPFRDITWQSASYFFYFLFAIQFADFKKLSPGLYRLLRYCTWFVGLYLLLDMILILMNQQEYRKSGYMAFRLLIIAPSIISIISAFRLRNTIATYLATGSACMAGGAIATLIFTALYYIYDLGQTYFPMQFMFLGILLEIMFFTFGLSYKTKLRQQDQIRTEMELRQERETKEMERLQTIVETQDLERVRVSRELHDDLGAGLSTVRFLSEVGKAKTDSSQEMQKISDLSNDLIDSMRQIIWAMNPENSSWKDFITYLKMYSSELIENYHIDFTFRMEGQEPSGIIPPDMRRNLFLIVKECLHNVIKHASATEVTLKVNFQEKIQLHIMDNGIGFQHEQALLKNGAGLRNIEKRMADLRGSIAYLPGPGTNVFLQLPVEKN